jgi:hypothetical protein
LTVIRDRNLTMRQQAALLALFAEGREMTNADLRAVAGLEIDKPTRMTLIGLGYLAVQAERRAFVHRLTDDGRAWCAKAMVEGQAPARSGPAGGVLFALTRSFHRGLARLGYESVADIIEADPQAQVRAVYARVGRPGARIGLNRIRDLLPDVSPDDLDATLRTMARLPDVHLITEDNLPALTDDERKAAVQIGGHERHIIVIEPA